MLQKMKFRKKIVFSQILLFCVFIAISLPFIEKGVEKVLISSLSASAEKIVLDLQSASSEEEMISQIENPKGDIFYLLSLYNKEGRLISSADSISVKANQEFINDPLEDIREALSTHKRVILRNSTINHREYLFLATPFFFQGNMYVLQGVFPFNPIKEFSDQFNLWFASLCIIALLIFGVFTWVIFGMLHKPIDQMIHAIKAYQSGEKEQLPKILSLSDCYTDEDFGRLADTLLSLYNQVQLQVFALTNERNEKEAILESLVEGVVAVNRDMQIEYVNFVGSKMLGIPKRHLTSKVFTELAGKNTELFQKCRDLLLAAQKHQTVVTDSLEVDHGKKIYLDLVATPKSQDLGAIIVLQDKSSQHRVLEMGKDFVANASHELRTPITIIKGFAETLQDMEDLPHEMLVSIVEKIVRNCERMENLVKNLLTLADMENISVSPYQSCDLVTLLENCMEIVHAIYTDAVITFTKEKDHIFAAADANILELAIINLITNAAKYSLPPAKIHIIVDVEGEDAKITIKDQGIGIPAHDVDHIFERFYTVNKAHSRKLGGAGLGLSLVKTIIDKHQGTISVSSELGVGSTFTIMIPLSLNP
ncbi:MAG: ATP-binding protein [Chlamydiae bacterium]|nr:ATP-binding protein [Chlamydiota bacterium]